MVATVIEPRSKRGKLRYAEKVLEPIDQIRVSPGGVAGAWCYYIRPDGATIRDALILAPNGAGEGKFGANSAYFRERAKSKGRIPLGQQLTAAGVKLLVETIAKNREDEILFVEDEIAEQDVILANAESQKEREIAHKRKRQYQVRLDTLNKPFDPDALIAELEEIARAQRLAKLDPDILAVLREEVDARTRDMMARFRSGKVSEESELAPEGMKRGPGRPRKVTSDEAEADFSEL